MRFSNFNSKIISISNSKLCSRTSKEWIEDPTAEYVEEYLNLDHLASFVNRQEKKIDNAWQKGSSPILEMPTLGHVSCPSWSLTEGQKSRHKVCQREPLQPFLYIKKDAYVN